MRAEHHKLKNVGALNIASSAILNNNLLQELKERQDTIVIDLEKKLQANFL